MKGISKKINDLKTMPVTVKASIVFLFVSLFQNGLGFLLNPIYTRILTSDEYGNVAVYLSMEQMIGTVAMFSLSAGCLDIGMQDYKEDRDNLCYSLLILSNVITVVCGIIVFALYPCIKDIIGVTPILMILMFTVFLFQPALTFWVRRERFEYHYKYPALITIISSLISCFAAIVCVLKYPEKRVEARLFGQYIPFILLYIVFWFYVAKKAHFKVNYKYVKFAFVFNLPLIPHYLSAYVLSAFDRLMINSMVGASQAGYYSLAYSISALVTIVWTAINSTLVPYVLDKYEKKDYKKVNDVVIPILVFFASVCILVILMAPEVIHLLATNEYAEAIYAIPPIIAGCFFQSLYYIFTNVLYYLKRPKIVMYASISSAVINIVLNYFGIKLFGYIAAGYTTLICFALQAFVDYIVVKKIMKIELYDKKKILFLSGGVIAISLLCSFTYSLPVVRYIILLIVIVFIWIKKNTVLQLLKNKNAVNSLSE